MKIALAVPRLFKDINKNINLINGLISEACVNGATLILLPEAALTGLINNDVYDHDIDIAVTINHKILTDFCDKAKANKVWLCFGFLEKEDNCIYDSAVLINPKGEIAIHYRRINPQWRAKDLLAGQYGEGVEMKSILTPFGKTVILICGDLFDENVISMLGPVRPDLILFPFARCFPTRIKDVQKEWDDTEKNQYVNQVRRTAATVAMSNYIGTAEIEDTSFGGAFVVNAKGNILASLPLLQEGLLYYDFTE